MENHEGSFATPLKIQHFLNALPYNPKPECKSPTRVLRDGTAHCFEGALFAASKLRNLGFPPLLMDLRAENDDDHVIALFKKDGCWGAVAKSNFTTLRYREPVYRTLRELAMSYFDFYFNVLGEKTLRARSRPLKLGQFDSRNWMETDEDLEYIGDAFTKLPYYPLIEKGREKTLSLADPDLVQAGLLGSNPAGLYVPKP
ncbi:MAG: hypothetical protein VB045_02500 [Synergistaceae bacterium]|nr:hypothetical protein [Synergistaceae bacterium]